MVRQIICIYSLIIASYEWGENIKLEERSPKIRETYIRNHLDEEILDLPSDSAFKKVFSDEKKQIKNES